MFDLFKPNNDLIKSHFDLVKSHFGLIKAKYDLIKPNFGFEKRYGIWQKNNRGLGSQYMGVGKSTIGDWGKYIWVLEFQTATPINYHTYYLELISNSMQYFLNCQQNNIAGKNIRCRTGTYKKAIIVILLKANRAIIALYS